MKLNSLKDDLFFKEKITFALPIFREGSFKNCGCGEIGRHARLRIWCREVCGFESLHPHLIKEGTVEKRFPFLLIIICKKAQ